MWKMKFSKDDEKNFKCEFFKTSAINDKCKIF